MDVFLIVLGSVVAPIVVAVLLAIGKKLVDIEKVIARDEERWHRQEELWQQNAEEHERAFRQISELKAGQNRLSMKLDILMLKLETMSDGADT